MCPFMHYRLRKKAYNFSTISHNITKTWPELWRKSGDKSVCCEMLKISGLIFPKSFNLYCVWITAPAYITMKSFNSFSRNSQKQVYGRCASKEMSSGAFFSKRRRFWVSERGGAQERRGEEMRKRVYGLPWSLFISLKCAQKIVVHEYACEPGCV